MPLTSLFIIFIMLSLLPVDIFVLYLFVCGFLDPSFYLFPFLKVVGVAFFWTVLSLFDLIFFVLVETWQFSFELWVANVTVYMEFMYIYGLHILWQRCKSGYICFYRYISRLLYFTFIVLCCVARCVDVAICCISKCNKNDVHVHFSCFIF